MGQNLAPIKQRILEYLDYKGYTKASFYQNTGISPSNFKGKGLYSELGGEAIGKILSVYDYINATWLLNGTGAMEKSSAVKNLEYQETEYGSSQVNETLNNSFDSNSPRLSNLSGVPYYDVDFQGGLDILVDDQTVNPSYYIDFAPYNDCDIWINVTGKSMSPLIANGDIAALKLLKDWATWIPPGEIYAIYTDEHRTIKIVSPCDDNEMFLLKSYNTSPEFVDTRIPKKIIKQMFRVKGTIKKFF